MALTAFSQWKPFMIIPSSQIVSLDHFMIKDNKEQEEQLNKLSCLGQKRKASTEFKDKVLKKIKIEEMIPSSMSINIDVINNFDQDQINATTKQIVDCFEDNHNHNNLSKSNKPLFIDIETKRYTQSGINHNEKLRNENLLLKSAITSHIPEVIINEKISIGYNEALKERKRPSIDISNNRNNYSIYKTDHQKGVSVPKDAPKDSLTSFFWELLMNANDGL